MDPLTYAAAFGVIVCVALLIAAAVPSLRASHTDPQAALRSMTELDRGPSDG